MAVFDDFWKALAAGIEGLAVGTFANYKEQVIKDGQAFAQKLKDDLNKWTMQIAAGELDADGLKWLIDGRKVDAEMLALKEKGLAKAALDEFFSKLENLIVGTVLKFFPVPL